MWTDTHFPAAMRSLNSSTRAKAIEIANHLLMQGRTDKPAVVSQSITEARQWSRCNHALPNGAGNTRPYAR